MSDDLIVVFVLKDTETRKYLDPMGLGNLGDDGHFIAGIANGECSFLTLTSEHRPVDIVLIPDSEFETQGEHAAVLQVQSKLKKRVFVCYHQGNLDEGMIDAQRNVLTTILGAKLDDRSYIGHHDSGPVFEALREISQAQGDVEKYGAALRGLTLVFSSDPLLEAKLELLHLCLTPSGAKIVMSDENCPALVRNYQIKSILLSDGKTVGNAVEELTGMEDPFDADYISKLEQIRLALLDESETSVTTQQAIAAF